MKGGTLLLISASLIGGFVLINNLREAKAQGPYIVPNTASYAQPVYPEAFPMYNVPQQTTSAVQAGTGVGVSSGGITYSDQHLSVAIPSDFLAKIPLLGTIFKK